MKTFFFCLLTLGAGIVNAQSSAWQRQLDSLVAEQEAAATFSGVIVVAQDGVPVYQRAIGRSDRDNDVPMEVGATFRLASITKAFTAILVMQLVDSGHFALTTPVSELIPTEVAAYLPRIERIAVADLLRHTSGLPQVPTTLFTRPLASPEEMIYATWQEKLPKGKFGAFRYNNLDYQVLEVIIETATGRAFDDVLRERILTPLGMENTGPLSRYDLPAGLVQGYVTDGSGELRPEPEYHIENFGAAGYLYGTAADLLKLDAALYDDSFLSAKARDLMYTSHPEHGYVAYGSWAYNYPFVAGQPLVIERRGGILGFNHAFIRMPGLQRTLILLSNTDRFQPDSFGNMALFKEAALVTVLSAERLAR